MGAVTHEGKNDCDSSWCNTGVNQVGADERNTVSDSDKMGVGNARRSDKTGRMGGMGGVRLTLRSQRGREGTTWAGRARGEEVRE